MRSLVVGAGAGGMAMALLLARSGKEVTLIDSAREIGGSLRRFRRGGVPFDTGFHFTGGFDSTLAQMLEALRLDDFVKEEPFRVKLYLAETGRRLAYPAGGLEELCEYLCGEFPRDAAKIRAYYRCEREVIAATPMIDLRDGSLLEKLAFGDCDAMTVGEFFRQQEISGELAGVLASAAMCHGTPPGESSMTNHCRVSYGLGQHISRVSRGGDAFLDGFEARSRELGIELRTNCRIAEVCAPDSRRECHCVTLDSGEVLECGEVFLAIHPRSILELLPPGSYRPLFRERVESLEDSCGFFSIYGTLETEMASELTSCLSCCDLDRILLPGGGGTGMGIVTAREFDSAGRAVQTVTAFESEFPAAVAPWSGVKRRTSDPGYRAYKQERQAAVAERVFEAYPEWRGKFHLLDSSTMLTFRDYIAPSGCAYGVRQKLGQPRIFGRLPVRNFYALGQSALIPGVMGTMMASFLLFRQLAGEKLYRETVFGK